MASTVDGAAFTSVFSTALWSGRWADASGSRTPVAMTTAPPSLLIRRLDSAGDQPSAATNALVGEFARRYWEVVSGRRTLSSLSPLVSAPVRHQVSDLLDAFTERAEGCPGTTSTRGSTPRRRRLPGLHTMATAEEQDPAAWQCSTLGAVRAQLVSKDAIEGSFTLQVGGRTRSIAVRLERGRRWQCVCLTVL